VFGLPAKPLKESATQSSLSGRIEKELERRRFIKFKGHGKPTF